MNCVRAHGFLTKYGGQTTENGLSLSLSTGGCKTFVQINTEKVNRIQNRILT